ncbi:MAG: sporulation protein YunB [Epulopiscium sp. Nele67-Bin004]|nr:MAG: sporulation protein YunB [Epulopiscium sp. Nele67-Bin004]
MKKRKVQTAYPPQVLARQYHQQKTHRLQAMLAILFIIIAVGVLYIQVDSEIMPSVMAMAELEATTIATEAINEAIAQVLTTNQTTVEDLLHYDYNDNGELVSWNVNSILINNLCAQIVSKCSSELKNIGLVPFEIPLGNLTGSRIFANLGPSIVVEILPVGTVQVDYKNDIKSTGINQVNHTVWLEVKATIQVVVPLFSNQIVVNRNIMLIDKVISGDVPPSYIQVPSQNVFDVMP